jgi:mannose-6-phosphate isomerase-like protein (cupin superfamily)
MTNDRLEFPDGAVVTVIDSPSDTAGVPLVMEFLVPPGAMPTAAHVHPRQEEAYVVRDGTMEVLIGSSWSTLEAGQSATVPAGTPHAFRNRSEAPVRFLNEHRPALRFEEYFRAVHGLSEAGKIKGGFDVGGVLYACVLMSEYGDTMQPAGGIQRLLIGGLAAVGRMLGYESRGLEASDPEPGRAEAGSEEDATAKLQNAMLVAVLVIFALALSRWWSRRLGRI